MHGGMHKMLCRLTAKRLGRGKNFFVTDRHSDRLPELAP